MTDTAKHVNARTPWSDDKTYAEAARIKIVQLEKTIDMLVTSLIKCRKHAQAGDSRGQIVTEIQTTLKKLQ